MPVSETALAECFSSAPGELGQVGRRTITLFFFLFFHLIYPGCPHYPVSLGSGNELRGSPTASQSDLQYVSVSLIKSRPYFPPGISASPPVLFWAPGWRRRTVPASWLLRSWASFALLLHSSSAGNPVNVCRQGALAACICSFGKPVMKEPAGHSPSTC